LPLVFFAFGRYDEDHLQPHGGCICLRP